MCSVYVIQLFDETAYASFATTVDVVAFVLHLFTCYKCIYTSYNFYAALFAFCDSHTQFSYLFNVSLFFFLKKKISLLYIQVTNKNEAILQLCTVVHSKSCNNSTLCSNVVFFYHILFCAAVVSNKSKKTRNDSTLHHQPDVCLYLFICLVVGLI